MRRSVVRYIVAIGALVALIAALAGIKVSQISMLIGMGKAMTAAGPPPVVVSTSVADSQVWNGALEAIGSIAAAKGVAVSNDAPGVVSKILFESGATVREGEPLIELDTSVEQAQLAQAKARLELATLTLKRSRDLLAGHSIAQAQFDADEAQLKEATTTCDAIRAQIARKTARAPFAGRLGIRAVNLGQYLNPGTTITTLQAIDSVFVDFSLPQQALPNLKVGMPVRVTLDTSHDHSDTTDATGVLMVIEPAVDTATRAVKLRATVLNKEEKFRPGMFVRASVVLPDNGRVVAIPVTSVVHAPYGDSVFVVEEQPGAPELDGSAGKPVLVARQQFIREGAARGDFVAIVDGITVGQTVVSAGAFKLRNGAHVIVNNNVGAVPGLNPRPENH